MTGAPGTEPRLGAGVSLAQLARITTGLLWLAWASSLSADAYLPMPAVLETVVAAAGLAVMALTVTVRSATARRRLDIFLIAGSIALVVALPLATVVGHGYMTDELAYDQAAAASLLHGSNPYTGDFTSALQTYGVGIGATMTLRGSLEPYLNYPALSFLLYVPAVASFGDRAYAAMLIDLVAWGLAGWIMWRLLDARLRPWVPVFITLPALLGAIIGGFTDSLFVPLELVTVCSWQRFSAPGERRWQRWVGPLSLGLACAVKQEPWFLVPFLLIAVSLESRRQQTSWWRAGSAYAALVGVAFLAPNLPFIVWNPGAWLTRVLMPFAGGFVPMGIGPAGLMRPLAFGGGALFLFSVAAAATLTAAAALLCSHYGTVRRLIPLLPALALFVSARPFASYLSFCVPALIVNAAAIRGAAVPVSSRFRRVMLLAGGASGVVACVTLVAALAIPAPLRIDVTKATATGTDLRLVARVVNCSNGTAAPHFFLAHGMYYNQRFTKIVGPAVLAPGEGATYEFSTVETPATPHPGDPVQIQAGTLAPDAISTSPVATVGG